MSRHLQPRQGPLGVFFGRTIGDRGKRRAACGEQYPGFRIEARLSNEFAVGLDERAVHDTNEGW